MDDDAWFRVRVTVPPGAATVADLVVDALWQHAPPAVEERSGDGATTFVAGYPSRSTAELAGAAFAAARWGAGWSGRCRC